VGPVVNRRPIGNRPSRARKRGGSTFYIFSLQISALARLEGPVGQALSLRRAIRQHLDYSSVALPFGYDHILFPHTLIIPCFVDAKPV
jgi:hypothetical protein